MRRAALLALPLLLAPLAPPGQAFHDPGVPLLDARDYVGDAYASWRVRAPADARIVFEAEVQQEQPGIFSVGTWVIEAATWERVASGVVTWVTGQGDTLHLGAAALPEGVHVRANGNLYGHTFGAYIFNAPKDGEWVLVTLVGSEQGVHGRFRLFGGAGVEVLGSTSGPGYFHAEADFPATLSAVARVHGPADIVVKAIEGAAAAQPVAGRLFALFQGFTNTGELRMGYDGPDGAHDGRAFYFLHGEPAGDYAFRIDHNVDTWDDQGVCETVWRPTGCFYEAPVWAVGADVAVP